MSNSKLIERAREILKSEAVIISAADIKEGIMEQIQLYFESDGRKRCCCNQNNVHFVPERRLLRRFGYSGNA